jgi:hypothetical protein
MASVTGADDGLREVEQNLVGDTMTSGPSSHRLLVQRALHRRWSIHRPVHIRQCVQQKFAQSFCASALNCRDGKAAETLRTGVMLTARRRLARVLVDRADSRR